MASGQAIAFALSLVLSRLYSPADFGAYLVFANLFAFFNIAMTLRFEQAILYAKTMRGISTLFMLSLGAGVAVSFLVFCVLAVAPPFGLLGSHEWSLAALIVLSALLSAGQRVIVMVFTRWKRFRPIAMMNLIKPGIVGFVQSILGFIAPSGHSLALGHSIAYLTLFFFACFQDRRLGKLLMPIDWKEIKSEAIENAHFPLYNMTQNLLFVASEATIPLAIVAIYGHAAGGLFWFATRLTTAPMQILVESLRPIIYGDIASRLAKGEQVAPRMYKDAVRLALPFLAAAIPIWFYGDLLFAFIFGPQWGGAASMAAILTAFAAVHAFAVPFIASLPVIKGQRAFLIIEVCVLLLRLTAFWSFSGSGVLASLGASCLAVAAAYVSFFIWVGKTVAKRAPDLHVVSL